MSEYLGLRTGLRFGGELDLCGLQDGVLLENVLLGLVVTERLREETHSHQIWLPDEG